MDASKLSKHSNASLVFFFFLVSLIMHTDGPALVTLEGVGYN